MKSRIQQREGEVCPSINLQECRMGEPLQDNYTGAGAALIACDGDNIVDLEYLNEDPHSNLKFLMKAWKDKQKVFVGMCSCVSFCDPQELSFAKKFSFPDLIDQIDTACIKKKFTIYH